MYKISFCYDIKGIAKVNGVDEGTAVRLTTEFKNKLTKQEYNKWHIKLIDKLPFNKENIKLITLDYYINNAKLNSQEIADINLDYLM